MATRKPSAAQDLGADELMLPQSMVDPAELVPHPQNPRQHKMRVIEESVDALGLYRPIVVNRGTHTGRRNEILAGHGTVEAFKARRPGERIQVSWVDVDEQKASQILLVDNRASDLGTYDERLLAELLTGLAEEYGNLDVTGYTDADLDGLVADLAILDEGPRELQPHFKTETPHLRGTRIIVLELPVPVFTWAQDHLQEVAVELGVVSNVEVFVRLLADHVGEPMPDMTVRASDADADEAGPDGEGPEEG